MMHFTQIFR